MRKNMKRHTRKKGGMIRTFGRNIAGPIKDVGKTYIGKKFRKLAEDPESAFDTELKIMRITRDNMNQSNYNTRFKNNYNSGLYTQK
jgi:hypothetical protein